MFQRFIEWWNRRRERQLILRKVQHQLPPTLELEVFWEFNKAGNVLVMLGCANTEIGPRPFVIKIAKEGETAAEIINRLPESINQLIAKINQFEKTIAEITSS